MAFIYVYAVATDVIVQRLNSYCWSFDLPTTIRLSLLFVLFSVIIKAEAKSVCLIKNNFISSLLPKQISVTPRSFRFFGPWSTKRRRKIRTRLRRSTTWPRCPSPPVRSPLFIHTFLKLGGLRENLTGFFSFSQNWPVCQEYVFYSSDSPLALYQQYRKFVNVFTVVSTLL